METAAAAPDQEEVPEVVEVANTAQPISTHNLEMDKKLGGGIPVGSLVLLEGQSDAGKSVTSQHFVYGALTSQMGIAYYTTENTVKSLLAQMASLNLDVTDYFLCDRLRIYPLEMANDSGEDDSRWALSALMDHFGKQPSWVKLIVVDSLTGLVAHSDDRAVIDFFAGCKKLCDHGRTIIAVAHSYAFDERMLIRVSAVCDAHFVLKMEQVGERLVKTIQVSKIRSAEQSTGNVISFDVEPGMGMRIIPLSKAKA